MQILKLGEEYWLANLKPVDPYLRWAECTGFRNLRRQGKMSVSHLSFIAERSSSSVDWSGLRGLSKRIGVPKAYDIKLVNGKVSTFATLRVRINGLRPDELNALILALLTHLHAKRLQLGYPRGRSVDDGAQKPPDSRPGKGRKAEEVVLGVIDDGCPFAHPDLCDADGHPRLVLLWQQSILDKPEGRWKKPVMFTHGRVLDQAEMAKIMKESSRRGELDEVLCYRKAFATPQLGYLKPSRVMLARASHGGSVMAVAAGRPANLKGPRSGGDAYGDLYGRAGDAASKAPLIFVDLPREQVEISSGRWISINALDGIRFILGEARRRFERHDRREVPVVVNLSSGSTAGAHIGQAMLERAMEELLDADPDLSVTLAAGNSRTQESHAQLEVPADGSITVGLFVPPMQRFDTHVEFWLPIKQDLTQVAVSVTSANGDEMMVWSAMQEDFIGRGKATRAALLFYPEVVQARDADRTMVLLAVSGTAISGSRKTAEPWPVSVAGPWRVTVHNDGPDKMTVQAWIERDEVVFGTRRDQAARFFTPGDGEMERDKSTARKANTMSNISTGQSVFTVGAYRGPTQGGPVAEYSGAPSEDWAAQHRYLPFAARADAGKSHPGVRVAGNRGNVMRRMNGTSVAAPQVARYVANEMARGLTRDQVEKALPKRPDPLPRSGKRNKVDPADGRKRL